MQFRPLGKTGFYASALGLGGESALYKRGRDAARIIERAVELGINYYDTAPLYQDSELNYGDVLPAVRDHVFIATKTDQRDYDGAWRQFQDSLKRLRVDHVDLLQIHHLDFPGEVTEILSDRGAVRMAQEAKERGLARFIGVTGHSDPEVLLSAVDGHPFDAILIALNAGEAHVHSFQERLLPRAVELGMGVMAMKVLARGKILDAVPDAEQAIRYVLSLPVSNVVIGVMNVRQLERNAEIVSRFAPLRADEMAALEAATAPHAREINFYRKGLEDMPFPVPSDMVTEAR